MNQPDMVLQLLQDITRWRPARPPARLSPATEHAYQTAERYRTQRLEQAS